MADLKFKTEELFDFCTQMSIVLSGELSIQDGLEIIQQDTQNQKMKEACAIIISNIKENGSFYISIKDESIFDDYMIHMVEIGEISGNLDSVMKELSVYYERADDLANQLREALMYPFVLLVMMWVVVGIVVWKVLPIFENVLMNMGSPLPNSANMMMEFGAIFATISFVVLSLLLIFVLFLVLNARKKGNQGFLSKFFLTRKLYHNISMAKMTYALSLFISSGYEIEEALSYLPEIVEEQKMKEKLKKCRIGMQEGTPFEVMIQQEELYRGMYANMLITGFRSGRSDEVMKKVSILYEKDVDMSIGAFLNTIEPTIVITLSIIVGIILLSVMLPLMSIMSSIG